VSDCEELVGVSHRRWWGWFCRVLFCIVWNVVWWRWRESNQLHQIVY